MKTLLPIIVKSNAIEYDQWTNVKKIWLKKRWVR